MIQIRINEHIYLKDPESSTLGKKIVKEGISLIDEIGFEQFTFKKLAKRISSTEASIYRYFENKHKLLIYLVSWYWNWLEYQLSFSTNNIASPEERLRIALKVVSQPHRLETEFVHINKGALHRIVVGESPKAYLSKEVDEDNKEGYFLAYKRLCGRIAEIAQEISPEYPYPHALVSTLIESAHDQSFFAEHLPRLTDIEAGDDEGVTAFLVDLALRALHSKTPEPSPSV
ncbi:MAG: TetR/AcrR family transcriptional regulator [Bacteroidetes bacterium]|nr:MAG: TetR/AcrR family transcriptional regulator [Bacteroidota bacterium]